MRYQRAQLQLRHLHGAVFLFALSLGLLQLARAFPTSSAMIMMLWSVLFGTSIGVPAAYLLGRYPILWWAFFVLFNLLLAQVPQ